MGIFDFLKKDKSEGRNASSPHSSKSSFSPNNPHNSSLGFPNSNNEIPNSSSMTNPQMSNDPLAHPPTSNNPSFTNPGSDFNLGLDNYAPDMPTQNHDMPEQTLNPSPNPGLDVANHMPQNHQGPPYPDSSPSPNGGDGIMSKNMEIVISKLDAIRLAIQNIDHRLSNLEESVSTKDNSTGGIPSYHIEREKHNF